MSDDLFTAAARQPQRSNVPELSVSELALSLKKTLEDTYGRVRVRGELSKVKIHASGHMYSDLKDESACLSVVCWRGTLAKLGVRPEEGMDVICTGRITTYPLRSNYQLVIDTMEPAGEGALLKMLEDRKRRLAVEGLFSQDRKKTLPFLPEVIGVVTSPSGAVIRDILHRLADRFPRRVLIWPVAVQGPGAADGIAAAIRGFDALPGGGPVPRPDLLIVARGGGSIEDLMPFNEESVVRAVADCRIPVISAVGHETDTTLIDHAADMRAPTPTAAAEMAVPVRRQLYAQVLDDLRRLQGGMLRAVESRRDRFAAAAARAAAPERLLEPRRQRFDLAAHRLASVFAHGLKNDAARLARLGGRLLDPRQALRNKGLALARQADRLDSAGKRLLDGRRALAGQASARLRSPSARLGAAHAGFAPWAARLDDLGAPGRLAQKRADALAQADRMLQSLSFKNVLRRGFAVVRDPDGRVLTDAAMLSPGGIVMLHFRDDGKAEACVTATEPGRPEKV